MQHAGRLQAISEHGSDNLEQIRAALPGSYTRLEQVLSTLKDDDSALPATIPDLAIRRLSGTLRIS